jgi:peptide/nickel transport system permease protein
VRLSRANTYSIREREFVLAARSVGARNRRIMVREIVPNVVESLLSYATVIVAALIVAEASLSFLGLGIQPPSPSWGNMISQADIVIQQSPQGVVIPAIFLFLTVVSFNRLGEAGRARRETRQSVL